MARTDSAPLPGTPRPRNQQPAPSGVGGGGGGGKGGGKKPADPYAAAQAKADRKEREAKAKAAAKYRGNAETLNKQVAAIQKSLTTGFITALQQRLANSALTYKQDDAILMEGYGKRVQSLKDAQADNAKAQADQSFMNLTNRGRERASAVSEAMANGAGESDTLKSQLMSLRNWNANEAEGTRAFYDGLRSTNSVLTDLNVDTKTGRADILNEYNTNQDQAYTTYHNQMSEGYTQLGNIYGQQAQEYGNAAEMSGSAKDKKAKRRRDSLSGTSFMNAANETAKVWKNPGLGDLANWQGEGPIQGETNASNFANATTVETKKRPEGAALRKW